ncbi:MAG: SDR family oxidoreductase [Chloroflexi bacterium]|nr:SDR family oxidoreductase [Chloroflexota bacterium]
MILVAGGTGHLGTALVPLLLARDAPVRVLTRAPERARRLLGGKPELAPGDVRDPPSLEAALTGVDAVVSAMTGFGPRGDGPRAVDYDGNLNLLRAAETHAVRRFVFVSIHGAAADHPMEIARMKYRAEEALRRSGLDWVIVRPTVFMRLWVGIVGDPIVKSGKALVFGRGDNPINFASERDVADVIAFALFDPALSRVFIDVGGPENVTLNQLVGHVECVTRREAKVYHVPVPLLRLSRLLTRPVRPDVAGMIEAGITLETADMRFDATDLRRRFPHVELRCMADIVRQHFSPAADDTWATA